MAGNSGGQERGISMRCICSCWGLLRVSICGQALVVCCSLFAMGLELANEEYEHIDSDQCLQVAIFRLTEFNSVMWEDTKAREASWQESPKSSLLLPGVS